MTDARRLDGDVKPKSTKDQRDDPSPLRYHPTGTTNNKNQSPQTYYDILELSKTNKSPTDAEVTSLDIKKAYRRLALLYHPDRNVGSKESTERFQQIAHAYETLSHAEKRARYDACIDAGDEFDHDGHVVGGGHGYDSDDSDDDDDEYSTDSENEYTHAFTTFNDLFNNDPFFADAFEDMDRQFYRRFQEGRTEHGPHNSSSNGYDDAAAGGDGNNSNINSNSSAVGGLSSLSQAICGTDVPRDIRCKGGFGPWLLDKMGVQLTVTTYKSDADGTVSASTYTNTEGGKGGRSGYTDRRTRTYTRYGKRVTVKSMERNGNKIEDTYVEGTLFERRVNGVLEEGYAVSNE
eukprot:CAMPEP_0178657166 /NCGR_PEP_ID=MMETSP0698-20121128/25227_1 /TAXON_ID=265572 /ORGANISM="Extubocellulus spinifer, Strain CCMP396" /LENGTH=347 /DNA_ID=CAMNT_0020299299 /DNA_START=311 /DNA_END=1354 /DNA_ORIENTATION=+